MNKIVIVKWLLPSGAPCLRSTISSRTRWRKWLLDWWEKIARLGSSSKKVKLRFFRCKHRLNYSFQFSNNFQVPAEVQHLWQLPWRAKTMSAVAASSFLLIFTRCTIYSNLFNIFTFQLSYDFDWKRQSQYELNREFQHFTSILFCFVSLTQCCIKVPI